MKLFGNSQAATANEVQALRQELAALVSDVRTLKLEWAEAHERLYRHMKRAETAARRLERDADEPPAVDRETPLQLALAPAPAPERARRTWGARARIEARRARVASARQHEAAPPDETAQEGE